MTNVDEMMTKKDMAKFWKCSLRQIELMAAAGRIPKPIYLGTSSPRWRRSELMAFIDRMAAADDSNQKGE
jgi:predicted DNA-binding transcriptional regulator AlpA